MDEIVYKKNLCAIHDGIYGSRTGRPFMEVPREMLKKIKLKIKENMKIYAII